MKWVYRIILGLLILPVVAVALVFSYFTLVPTHTASVTLKDNVVLAASLYEGFHGYRKYIRVNNGQEQASYEMKDGFARRISIYFTKGGQIVVLGAANENYLISRLPLTINAQFKLDTDDWDYIGAFDFRYLPRGGGLNKYGWFFIPWTEQYECVPALSKDVVLKYRRHAQREQCPPQDPV